MRGVFIKNSSRRLGMSNTRLFRNFGDEETSDLRMVKINHQRDTIQTPCAAIIPGRQTCKLLCIIPVSENSDCIFAGIQGVVAKEWYTFGARLTIPVYIIQLIGSMEATSIEQISEAAFDTVRDCFSKQKQFYIVGHSFGAIVAIQLAQLLERNGANGRVLLVDGSPDYLQRMSKAMIKTTSKKESEEDATIMLIFFNGGSGERTHKFIMQLQECKTWSQKMDLLYRHMPETLKSNYSSEYLYELIHAMSNRLKAVMKMNLETAIVKLKSPVMLLRPKLASFNDIADDYELSKYAEQPVEVRYIDGDHLTMLDNTETTKIIESFAPLE